MTAKLESPPCHGPLIGLLFLDEIKYCKSGIVIVAHAKNNQNNNWRGMYGSYSAFAGTIFLV